MHVWTTTARTNSMSAKSQLSFVGPIFFWTKHLLLFFGPNMFSDQKFFLNEFVFGPINFTYFDKTLKECFWEHLEQIPTITVTFVHTIFVLAIFFHIRNISAVTDPILTKLFEPNFLGALIFLGEHLFWTKYLSTQK